MGLAIAALAIAILLATPPVAIAGPGGLTGAPPSPVGHFTTAAITAGNSLGIACTDVATCTTAALTGITAGDTIIVGVSEYTTSTGAPTGVEETDGGVNYALTDEVASACVTGSGHGSMSLWGLADVSAAESGTATFTATYGGAAYYTVHAFDVHGTATAPFDVIGTGLCSANAGNTTAYGGITTTAAGDLIILGVQARGTTSPTITATGGDTLINTEKVTTTDLDTGAILDESEATAGSYHLLATIAPSDEWASVILALKAAPTPLTAPTIAASNTPIDSGMGTTLSTTSSFSGGTSPYTCQWLEEAPGAGSYSSLGASFACTAGSLPTTPTGALNTVGTWTFELQVTDSSAPTQTATSNVVSVVVNSALVAPVIQVAPTAIDLGQSATLSTTTSFSGGTSTYTCQWLEKAPGAGSYSDLGGSFACTVGSLPTVSTGVLGTQGTWSFELQVTDSASPAQTASSVAVTVTVSGDLTAPVISASPTAADEGQSSTISTTTSFSGGTAAYTCQWLVEAPGAGGYSDLGASFACTVGSTPTTGTGSLGSLGTWSFELQVTDSSTPTTTVTSNVVTVTVNAALTAPTISASPTEVDNGQSSTLSTTIPWSGGTAPYTCQWLEEAPSAGSYSNLGSSFACTTASLPTLTTPGLTITGTYSFELQVADSGSPSVPVVSAPATVVVNAALGAATISISPTTIDSGQSSNLSTTGSFQGGTPGYTCEWLVEVPGSGTYTAVGSSFPCTAGSTPSISTGPLSTPGTYSYELQVTDSGSPQVTVTSNVVTLTVDEAMTAPVISANPSTIDSGQSTTLSTTSSFSGGASPYTCQWLEEAPGAGSYGPLGSSFACNSGDLPTVSSGALATTGGYTFELQVTDSSVPSVSVTSNAVAVTVDTALVAPSISASPDEIDSGQGSTLTTTTSFNGGTLTYSCQWLEEAPGSGSFSVLGGSFACNVGDLPTASSGALSTPGTWSFELQVTDSSSPPVIVTSNVVSVTVNIALSAPVISANPTAVDSGEATTLTTGTSFSGGTSPYTCQWLEEAPGAGSFSALGNSFACNVGDLPTVSSGALDTTGTWSFELQVSDSSTPTLSVTSNIATVDVNTALVAPVISASPTTVDSGQTSDLSTTTAWSGGTSPYTCQWLEEAPGTGSYSNLGSSFACTTASLPSQTTPGLVTTGTYLFELEVTDSSTPAVTATSNAVSVLVNGALVGPTISVSPSEVDSGDSSTLSTTTSFSGGTSTYSCQWIEEAPSAGSYSPLGSSFSCNVGDLPSTSTGALATLGTWSFELQVTDSGTPQVIVASTPVTVTVIVGPSSPTITADNTPLDAGMGTTLSTTTSFSGGTSPYTCQWLEEAPGAGAYSNLGASFACTAGSLPTTPTGALNTVGTWTFELQVTDSSAPTQTATSNVVSVIVNSALVAPVIQVAPTAIDLGQSATLSTTTSFSGGTSTYTCQWLVEAPGAGSYSTLGSAFACSVGDLPSISSGSLGTTGSWSFELQVTDSASPSVTVPSASVSVVVNSVLTAATISASPSAIDSGQSSTLTTTGSFQGGTSAYTCEWWVEVPGSGTYTPLGSSFSCTAGSTPSSSTGVLATTGTYSYELQVTDSGSPQVTVTSNAVTVLVNVALSAPSISASPTTLDSGEATTLTTTSSFSGGTSPFSCQWLEEAPGSGTYTALGSAFACNPGDLPTVSSGALATVGTWSFELQVTDGSTPSNALESAAVSVTVNAALTAPVVSASPSALDLGQNATLSTVTSFSGGTAAYTCQWLEEVPGAGSYSDLGSPFTCSPGSTPAISTGALTATGPYSYVLQVTDGAIPQISVISNAVTVTVNVALTGPTISADPTAIDPGETSTLTTTTSFSGGTSPFTCQWLEESPGTTSYTALGSPFACSDGDLPTVSSGILVTAGVWSFELQVSDAASPAQTMTSAPATVSVSSVSPLTAPTISGSPSTIDSGQSATLSTTTSWTGGVSPDICQWLQEAPGATSYSDLESSFTCDPGDLPAVPTGPLSSVGTWSFELQVTDRATPSASVESASVSVVVSAAFVAPTIGASPTAVDSGQASTLSTSGAFQGGTPGFTCEWWVEVPGAGSYSALGSPFSCSEGSTPSTPTGALTLTGSYAYELQVTDGGSPQVTVTSNVVRVTVSTDLLAPTIEASPTTVVSGEATTLTTTSSFSGGTSPDTCQWLEEAPGAGSFSDFGSPFACSPGDLPTVSSGDLATTGTWSMELQVTDAATPNISVTSLAVSVTVTASVTVPPPLIVSFLAVPSVIALGSSTMFESTVSGVEGTLMWTYMGLPAGCTSTDFGNFTCTPTVTGTFTVRLYANDSAGGSATATTVLKVNPQTVTVVNPTFVNVPIWEWGMLLALLACLVALLFIILLAGRRRKEEPQEEDERILPATPE